jgi:uncharacterized membrane protein YeaQ/YmgE (transglycosylase-associated protein family)
MRRWSASVRRRRWAKAFERGTLARNLLCDPPTAQDKALVWVEVAMVLYFVILLLLGVLVGILARWRLHGEDAGGWLMPIGLAVAGSMVGGSIASGFFNGDGPRVFLVALISAAAVVLASQAMARRRLRA